MRVPSGSPPQPIRALDFLLAPAARSRERSAPVLTLPVAVMVAVIGLSAVGGWELAGFPGWGRLGATIVIATSLLALSSAIQPSRSAAVNLLATSARLAALAIAALVGPAAAWAVILIAGCFELPSPDSAQRTVRRILRVLVVVQAAATALVFLPTEIVPDLVVPPLAALTSILLVAIVSRLTLRNRPIRLPSAQLRPFRIPFGTLGVAAVLTIGFAFAARDRDSLIAAASLTVLVCVVLSRIGSLARHPVEPGLALEGLMCALDHREPGTAAHSRRVHTLVTRMVERISGLGQQERDSILAAAMVHDIGKVATPDRTLHKPGRLDAHERAIIQRHAMIGAEILRQAGSPPGTVDIVLHHHERWDGVGYPEGLFGDRIPLGARLIAVADAWDAMTNDRAYRRALSNLDAMSEIVGQRGRQFDPDIVDLFGAMIAESLASRTIPSAIAS